MVHCNNGVVLYECIELCIFTNNYLTSNTNTSLDVYGEPRGSLVESYNEMKIVSPTFNLNSTSTCSTTPDTSREGWNTCVCKDPHLFLAHGGRTDFRGENQNIYNILSSKDLTLNFKIE